MDSRSSVIIGTRKTEEHRMGSFSFLISINKCEKRIKYVDYIGVYSIFNLDVSLDGNKDIGAGNGLGVKLSDHTSVVGVDESSDVGKVLSIELQNSSRVSIELKDWGDERGRSKDLGRDIDLDSNLQRIQHLVLGL